VREENGMKGVVREIYGRKISVKCKIEHCRISGKVIIMKLRSEEEKKEVISNKSRLKGDQIFVENDLSWKERKIQKRINI